MARVGPQRQRKNYILYTRLMKPWLGEVLTYRDATETVTEGTLTEIPVLYLGMCQLPTPIYGD